MNEQIATALLRLQHDMAAVLHRLHALEALTLLQVKGCGSYVAGGDLSFRNAIIQKNNFT